MLSDIAGWIDGITASCVVIFGIIFGFYFLYKAKKLNAKILSYLALANIFAGLLFLGVFLDFIYVVTFNQNFNNTYGLVGILSYIWLAPTIITATYIGVNIINPKSKWFIFSISIILSIIFEVLMFFDPLSTFQFNPPPAPGTGLIDYNLQSLSPGGILTAIMILFIMVILGFGFLIKGIKATGVIRKKFFLLSIGSFCFCVFGMLEGLTAPGIALIFVRVGFLSSFWFMYFGLKS
ncbi:MAG: hypothetical protein ACTSRH_03620 [Promethearchaeota archaeon]